ncbi:inositol monophosphatase [Candidatus Binatia bacterium]|nr:inositol monophosphatase [Candidatus Binatia bacterium]
MSPSEPEALANLAGSIAREAGALIRERYDAPRTIATKSAAVDLVTDTDQAAERMILERLRRLCPDHAILSEESGALDAPATSHPAICWVIDPLDGTTNFAHGIPHFAVSIAAVRLPERTDRAAAFDARKATPFAGAVFDPMRDELFVAHAGGRTTLNGCPVRTSSEKALGASLVATGFPYDRREHADFYLAFWRRFLVAARDVRRIGAAALDLAWVACGRVDAFWEWRLKPWDVAAGNLLVQCAGGTVTDFAGHDPGVDAEQTLASNGVLHEQMLAVLRELAPAP